MRQLRTLDEVTEQYFRDHPDEIADYLAEIFQAYAEDNDTGTLLASLRILALVQGVSDMATRIGMSSSLDQAIDPNIDRPNPNPN
jgi:HTH-type transcriptional regulator / antitoxin HigA